MKLIILLAVIGLSNCAKLNRGYLPPSHAQTSGGSEQFLQAPNYSDNYQQNEQYTNNNNYAQNEESYNENQYAQNGVNDYSDNVQRAERPRAAFERTAAILRQDSENDGERYSFAFETENGITAEESGVATNGVEAQGGYSYTGDDGQVYSVRYTAGENGFVPQGDHLPTPPPIPKEILEALEQNARDEAAGIFDDGSYQEAKYNTENQQEGYNYNDNRNQNYVDDSISTNTAYLPPHEESNNQEQLPEVVAARNVNFNSNNVPNNYLPPKQTYAKSASNAVASVPREYLPPTSYQNQANSAPTNGVTVATSSSYLPPNQEKTAPRRPVNVRANFRQAPEVTKAYLPPRQLSQNNNQYFGAKNTQRRPSFNSNNGYQY